MAGAMGDHVAEESRAAAASAPQPQHGAPRALLKRPDGVYLDTALPVGDLLAAVNQIFQAHTYFSGLDYPALLKALYGIGPDRPPGAPALQRVAADILAFAPERQGLYRAVKISGGCAEYYFEPLFFPAVEQLDGSELPERPASLDADEFVADLWLKGVRFGVDVAALKQAIRTGRSERVTVARQLDPTPGQDAMVVEVSQDLHRSDAPRTRADGRIDLLSFQNRFPQISKGMRLLKKEPPVAGLRGVDLGGATLLPEPPRDLDLGRLAGAGTVVEHGAGGEFLIAVAAGFLSVDPKSQCISVNDKIVSRDGVSGRTTGNLQLAGAYEEFGDVQELREVTGSDITVRGNVYGKISSKGGQVLLAANLVGGSVHNAAGDIEVRGVASGALLQAAGGTVTLARAENCVISASRVRIDSASNCEIVADEVSITLAEGCAVAGRLIAIDSAGPRKNTEMTVLVLLREQGQLDGQIGELRQRCAAQSQAGAALRLQIEELSQQADVRRYLALAARLREQDVQLTAEQSALLRKIAAAVAGELQELSRLTQLRRQGAASQLQLDSQLAALRQQRREAAGSAACTLRMACGEVLVRTMATAAGAASLQQLAPKELQQRLRSGANGAILFDAASGALDWQLDAGAD